MTRTRSTWVALTLAAAVMAFVSVAWYQSHDAAAQETAETKPGAAAIPDRATLEKRFAETMNGATLVGSFTLTGQPLNKLTEEKYTIGRVRKLEGDTWLIESRIQYGGHDVNLPLRLQVLWSGDTPVITLTNLQVPPLGVFTARVLIYDNQYAGTWSGGDHGGHLFGRIEPAGAATDKKPEAAESK